MSSSKSVEQVQITLAVTIQAGEQLGLLLQLQQSRHKFLIIQLKAYMRILRVLIKPLGLNRIKTLKQ